MEFIFGLVLALIVFLMANGLFRLFNRPKIVPIDKSDRPNAALVVIDMQDDFTRSKGKMAHDPDQRDAAIEKINSLASAAHEAGMSVIEVRHSYVDPLEKTLIKLFMGGAGVEGSAGLKRDDALTFHANVQVWKHEGDSFSSPMFDRFITDHKIGHLYLTGQDGTACINATARAALKRNFEVTLLDEAILARNGNKWADMREKLLTNGAKAGVAFSEA